MSRVAQVIYSAPARHYDTESLHEAYQLDVLLQSTDQKTSSLSTQSIPSCTTLDQHMIPTSVRGAPLELRRVIRKRQNSESAKRCRQRKKVEDARAAEEIMTQSAKLQHLEATVERLAERLHQTQALLAALTSTSSSATCHNRVGCANGAPHCTGSECVLCASAMDDPSLRAQMPMVSSPSENASMASSQMPSISMQLMQNKNKHTQELHLALEARPLDELVTMANKGSGAVRNGWQ